MRLQSKQLLNLPVYTESQHFLGRVMDFEMDTSTHQVIMYSVGSSSLVKKLLGEREELLINHEHVISLTEEKMTVQDNILKERVIQEESKLSKISPIPAPASTSASLGGPTLSAREE